VSDALERTGSRSHIENLQIPCERSFAKIIERPHGSLKYLRRQFKDGIMPAQPKAGMRRSNTHLDVH
jgi:hypothetical protein